MTMTRTLPSSRAASSSDWSASMSSTDRALAGGLFSVRRRIASCCSVAMNMDGLLDRVQRVRKIGDEVVGVLAADRNSHQIVGDVELLLAFLGHRQVSH